MRILTLYITLLVLLMGCSRSVSTEKLEDGIYLILRSGFNQDSLLPLEKGEHLITFNKEFLEKTDHDAEYIVVNQIDFVELRLKHKPTTEVQEDKRKNLLLSMTEQAKEELAVFSEKQLGQMTTIVVGGEALTMHRFRSVIDGGLLQVTRCNDNACEMLFEELQDNVVNTTLNP